MLELSRKNSFETGKYDEMKMKHTLSIKQKQEFKIAPSHLTSMQRRHRGDPLDRIWKNSGDDVQLGSNLGALLLPFLMTRPLGK